MSWPASFLVALLAGALGLVAAGLVMAGCVRWYRVSSFEGKAGYAVVTVAFLGGVAGMIVGLAVARMVPAGGVRGFLEGLGIACGVVLVAAGLSAGIARCLADVPPTIGGQELLLEVEIRLPADTKAAPGSGGGESYLDLHSVVRRVARKSKHGDLRPADARLVDGRWVVPGSAFVFTERGMRSIGVRLDGQPPFGFIVPLPARPTPAYEAWSDWGPRPRAPNPPWPDTKPSFRFRVQRIRE